MTYRKVQEDIYSVGAIDWHRSIFDELIPLPDGTTYNAYFIKGEMKNALIDTVDPEMSERLLNNLDNLGVEKIDYLISNHAEQDHSGSIPHVLEKYPEATVLTGEKGKEMLLNLLDNLKEEQIQIVEDGETVSLGDKTLEFVDTPWVHWPETISTYLKEDNILFSCDFFGSHLAVSELFVADEDEVYRAAKRYYAEIMMPFRKIIQKNLEKLEDYEIDMIAPSHGPIYDRPELIVDAYKDWTSDKVKPQVVIPYISMHGSTEEMVEYLIDRLLPHDIKVIPFKLTEFDLGDLAISLVDASTVVIGSPTVLTGPHPLASYAASVAGILRPKTRYASIIGSYGWHGKLVEKLSDHLSGLNVDMLDPVISKGKAEEDLFAELDRLAEEIIEKNKEL